MAAISGVLPDRLGEEGAGELQDVLDGYRRETVEQVSLLCVERVERRVLEESSKLRLEIGQTRMDLRSEIADLRTETRAGFVALRGEMSERFATLRGDMARDRFELLKWAFAFWVGQLFASVGLMAVLLRAVRP